MTDRFRRFFHRLRSFFGRTKQDRELDAEISAHLELAIEENLERGLSALEARRQALVRFGGQRQTRERHREARGLPLLETLLQDLRFALRMLGKSPGFTAIAVLTLALGIGANTALFSVINGVLLNPLPFPNANRIVAMFQDKPNFPKGSISYPNFLDWRQDNRCFASIAAYRWADGTLRGTGEPEEVRAQRVSATFFSILGVRPILGRNFTEDEDRRGANPTVILSEGLWKRKFASDPNILGKAVNVGGAARTVIGVIPTSFRLHIQNFKTADLYEPVGQDEDEKFHRRDSFWGMDAIGLLKPGVTLEQAREDMKRVNSGLAATYPDIDADIKANLSPLKEEIVGEMRSVLLVLFGAVGFVLLIASVNVANLLLARSTGRRREFSIRVALGAGRAQILRQLLTESVVLALLGGALGLILANWGTSAALAAVPRTVPRAEDIGLDPRVLLFTLIVSVAVGILFGLVPALKISGTDVGASLKDTGRAISMYRSRTQAVFVVGEMAMALVLLIGAGLMIRTLAYLWGRDPGFDPHNVLSFGIDPPPSLAAQPPDAIRAELGEIHRVIRSTPGVEHVSFDWGALPMASDDEVGFWPEGQPQPARQADYASTLEYVVEPEYLQTMGIPLLRGRFISDADDKRSERVAVIDNSFAQKYFPGQDPLGKHVKIFDFDADPSERTWIAFTIVGVVGHVNQFGLADDATQPLQAQMYRSLMQGSDLFTKNAAQGLAVFARFHSSLSSQAFFETIRSALVTHNGQMIVSGNESEEEIVAHSIANQRFSMALLGVFAALALLLASVGIYGVLSYLVGERRQEIGVRMALGAKEVDVLRLVLSDGARMTLVGIGIGVVAAVILTRLMAGMLYGVAPTDPVTFAMVALFLSGVALLACYIPARRASRVDPVVALRYQ
ncbi:MAG TPA: ABC transporter permease [Candidatus Acidoferrum sp.]|nr:ABC transporter permease [Candidatus Acidoferrum sp.]